MKKLLVALIGIFTIILVSCSAGEKVDTVTVTDMLGDTITIKKNPEKVACVSRTTYDLLVAFGLGDKIDGAYTTIYDNPWTEIIYPKSKNEYRYNYVESYETFYARDIDLVFAPEKYISDGLKEHGINALCVSLYGNPTFDNYVYYFSNLVTQIWDDEEVAIKVKLWNEKVKTAITSITNEMSKHDIEKNKIMYVRGDKNKGIEYTDTKGSFTEYAFRILGFEFAGSNFESNRPSQEEICKYNPDVFVIGGVYQNVLVDKLKNDEVYGNLEAVKQNKIYTIPIALTMFEQLSIMTPIFFYDMANKIYPEYFNYDVKTMIKDTIYESFGTMLNDEQVEYILNGKDMEGNDLA